MIGPEAGLGSIMSICQGAWGTKVLSVALEVGLFTRVSGGAGSIDAVSQESGMDVRVLRMLANACKALGLIEGRGNSLKNSAAAEKFLVKGRGSYVGDFIMLVGEDYYDVWRGLKEVVMTGKPVRDDRMVQLSNPRYAEAHIRAMQGISRGAAESLAAGLGLSGRKSLLEIGGGAGTYSISIARKNPGIKATVFDSPFACEQAGKNIEASGISNVSARGWDFKKSSIPKGHDVIMLTHVLQDMTPPGCEAMLGKVHEALPKGGMVVVNEFLLGDGGTSPAFSSLLALNSFMLSNGGSLYSQEEISGWLRNAGFERIKSIKTSEFIISLNAIKVR